MILGFLYFYYVNKSNKILIDNITMINLQNLIICPPFKGLNLYISYESNFFKFLFYSKMINLEFFFQQNFLGFLLLYR